MVVNISCENYIESSVFLEKACGNRHEYNENHTGKLAGQLPIMETDLRKLSLG